MGNEMLSEDASFVSIEGLESKYPVKPRNKFEDTGFRVTFEIVLLTIWQ
jgi:hypothetical protein